MQVVFYKKYKMFYVLFFLGYPDILANETNDCWFWDLENPLEVRCGHYVRVVILYVRQCTYIS